MNRIERTTWRGGTPWTISVLLLSLADPCRVLQGDRVSKRFVPIGTVTDAERPEIAALIRQAAALHPTEWG